MESARRGRAGQDPAGAEASAPGEPRRRARLTPVGRSERLEAFVLAPASPDIEVLRAWLGAEWHVTVVDRPSAVEEIDPGTHLVLLDDRCGAPLLPLAKAVAERAPAARIILSVEPASIGEILAAGLERVALGFLFRPLTQAGLDSELRGLFAHGARRLARHDRRGFPRAELEDAAVLGPPGVDLRNISPGGALLVGPPGWSAGSRHTLELRLTPGAPVQKIVAEVLSATPDPLGRVAAAVRFVDPMPRFTELVRAATLEHLTRRDLRARSQRVRHEASGREPLEVTERIAGVLRKLGEERCPCSVSSPRGGKTWRTAIAGLDEERRRLALEWPHVGRRARPEERLEVFVQSVASSYLFEVRVLEQAGRQIWCAWPEVIYHSEKRTHPRRPLPRGAPAFVEIDAPPPWGRRRWPIHDVSSNGLSFVVSAHEGLMLPGTPLRGLRLLVGGHPVAEHAAEIRHVVPRGDGTVKVGVGLVSAPRATRPKRPRRSGAETSLPPPAALPLPQGHPAPEARRVQFLNSRNELVAGLLNTSFASGVAVPTPVVIVAPSFGKTKEGFSTLALWLTERFARQGKPVAVLRFDFTHSNGESHVPAENRSPGRECLDFTLSSALDDLSAAVRFVHSTPLLDPSAVVLVGYSVSSPLVLRAAAEDPRVGQVVSIMGAASLQQAVRASTGGVDYVADYLRGHRHGLVNFLGFLVDMDAICRDALASGFATDHDTARDLAALQPDVAVGWIVGEHDAWVDRREIGQVLEAKRGVSADLVVVPTGHVPTRSEEATAVAEEIARLVWRAAHGTDLPSGPGPTPETLERVAREEWSHAPRASVADRRAYWASYLLGERTGELGFDVLEWVEPYREFMAQQVRLLELGPGDAVLDAGGGTGNFILALLESSARPARVEVADLVPEALARAREKTRAAAERAGIAVDFRVKTLEVSRLRPVERFVRGEVHGPDWLRGRIEGLDDAALDHVLALYGPAMHAALRGAPLDGRLAHALSDDERAVVDDIGRAARLVRGCLRPDDLARGVALPSGEGASLLRTSQLRFSQLVFGDAGLDERLAFESGAYDAIVTSLVLPYVRNPDETVRELYRALRPGGRLVASSNRPNTDMSIMFTRLVEDVATGRVPPPAGMDREGFLEQLRAYTNSAAFLLRLEEEQTFRFFEPERLGALLEQAGFEAIAVHAGFGDPPQAFVAVGRKPAGADEGARA